MAITDGNIAQALIDAEGAHLIATGNQPDPDDLRSIRANVARALGVEQWRVDQVFIDLITMTGGG